MASSARVVSAEGSWGRDQEAASILGTERRRIVLAGVLISILAPLLPYLTGTWEMLWYTLAATDLPFWARTPIFLAGFFFAIALVQSPLVFHSSYVLSHRFLLSHQPFSGWISDWLKVTLLEVILGGAWGSTFIWAVSSSGGAWWWRYGALLSAGIVVMIFLMPYLLVPLFYRVRPVDDGRVAARIEALARRAGARIQEVDALDFSRRGVEANAAVIGIGSSRRIVIADNLLKDFAPDEVDAVVAHELGHHVRGDIVELLLIHLAVLWVALAGAAALAPVALPVLSLPTLGYVPGFPELYALTQLVLLAVSPITNWWSRRLEARADTFALQLTANPLAFAAAMRRIAAHNLVEASPPGWAQLMLGTHPSLAKRIQMAEAWNA